MTKISKFLVGLVVLVSALPAQSAPASTEARLLRFPATDGRQVVFSYADQLYTVGLEGGTARRLTAGPGYAIFPRFSPDGKELAFTAQYDGNTEVYLMPAEGGVPRRLTFTATLSRDDLADRMGPNNVVMAWTHTTGEVLFRSRMRSFNAFNGQLYAVGGAGDLPRQLPVPRGGFMSFSPDDTKMAYNRVFREFRTWKAYRGGMADDIWIYDFKTGAVENITNNPAQDIIPMWGPDNHIYFLSDRLSDGATRLNLYSYDLATQTTAQLTHFKEFDIKFPSLGGSAIVFEEAGYLWAFDLKTKAVRQIPIEVKEDQATARAETINLAAFVASVSPSPDAKRMVVNARGGTFTVPAKDGPTRTLGARAGVHERDASWSPDGRLIAYLSDASGEFELYVRPQDGSGPAVQLTSGADTYYYAPRWSPDSKKLLWSDRLQRLRYVTVGTKAVTLVDTATAFEISQYDWAPDSQWVAWTRPEEAMQPRVFLYSLASGRKFPVTDGWYESGVPAFSDDGKFLLLASGRDFKPTVGDMELEHVYTNLERVYLIALAKSTPSPFQPKSDEVDVAVTPAPEEAKKKEEATKAVTVKVDEDGIMDRIVGLPIKGSNYDSLRAVGDKVYYLRNDTEAAGEDTAPPPEKLLLYDLKERKETELGSVKAFEISRDGKKMLVQVDADYAVLDVPTEKFEVKDKLSFQALEMTVDRHAEWAQIYDESWRQMRDFFFSPTMNGTDWPAQRAKYAALVPFAQTRYDLTYLIGELIGELHSGHAYVGGGDSPKAPRIPTGLLGAELSRDPASRAYRIDLILPGENWEEKTRSPLTELGVDVKQGDFILAVDGSPVRDMTNIYAALLGKAGKQVALRVNSKPTDEGARTVIVVPTADEGPLYYKRWVNHNAAYVSRKTGGLVGYVHIPDMGLGGLGEFTKQFYPQLRKHALIVDDRGNGGGFVSPMIYERLSRELVMYEKPRNSTAAPDPRPELVGPKVVLMDEFSASDGDIFPYRVKTLHFAKLIGKRSWGGVVGIRESLPFVDGGTLNRPEFAPYSIDGKLWPVEGHGVDPDIVVDNDPGQEFRGTDQQLDRAVEEILAELKTQGRPMPPPPPWPNRM